MRAVCGLFAVLFVLGPIGMGMLFSVDAPLLENDNADVIISEDTTPEDHGTRASPDGAPTFVNLYFHRTNDDMNTTSYNYINPALDHDMTFILQDPLAQEFMIENPSPGYPMTAGVYLTSSDTDLTVNVYDNEGGTLVGTASTGPFTYSPTIPAYVEIDIPFVSGTHYNFSASNSIVIEFDFASGTGYLHYDYSGHNSFLRLYGTTIKDISIVTKNYNNDQTSLFFPYNIDLYEERKKVIMEGTISDVFEKRDGRYVDRVEVRIIGPGGTDELNDADYDRETYEYDYTWNYPDGQNHGMYTITTIVYDEQDNFFNVTGNFNMSAYGVVLTSPSQEFEGKQNSDAKQTVPLKATINYTINVWNVGNLSSPVNITTTGNFPTWNWWLEGENLEEEGKKTGDIANIDPGQSLEIILVVDAVDNEVGDWTTVVISAAPFYDSSKTTTLNAITDVGLRYDVELKFLDGKKTAQGTVELDGEISHNFKVKNKGGSNDTIWIDVGNTPSGWSKELSLAEGGTPNMLGGRYYVELDPDMEKEFTFTLTAPASGQDDEFNLEISGESEGSYPQTISDTLIITTILTSGIELELETDGVQEVDPEDEVDFVFKISNTGTNSADYSVSYSTASGGFKSGDISFSETQLNNIAADDDDTFTMTVEPSADVEAGNHSITVRAIRNNDQDVYKEITVYCLVTAIPSLELIEPSAANANLYGEGSPGDDVEYQISFTNTGNVDLTVNIAVSNLPEGWTVFFGNGSSVYSEEIIPGDTEEVDITFSIPDDAEGDETVDISISVIPSQGDSILIETHTKVEGSISQTFLTLLVPILLFVVIIVMVIVIYRRR